MKLSGSMDLFHRRWRSENGLARVNNTTIHQVHEALCSMKYLQVEHLTVKKCSSVIYGGFFRKRTPDDLAFCLKFHGTKENWKWFENIVVCKPIKLTEHRISIDILVVQWSQIKKRREWVEEAGDRAQLSMALRKFEWWVKAMSWMEG